jgi:hypothetical protein
MLFTPFHMVIGVAAKALAPKLISLQVFALTQVAMDIEPGVRMAMDSDVLHGWSHTLAGAIPVALASAVAWKILERRRIWRWTFDPITPAMLWSTCFVGTWSHVLLDALIHRDMASTRELLPLDQSLFLSHEAVQIACMVCTGVAALVLAARLGWPAFKGLFVRIGSNLSKAPAWFSRPAQ